MIPSLVVFIRRNTCSLLFGSRAKWKGKYVAMLVFALIVLFILRGLSFNATNLHTVTTQNLQDYCNFPVNDKGMEGTLNNKDYKLQTVQILIRHGDRSPIFDLQEIDKINLDCSMNPKDVASKSLFSGFHKSLKFIKSQKLSPKTIKHRLSSTSIVCKFNGQLTQRGFKQLMDIGQYLRKAYKNLQVTSARNIYARSTNYDRTSQTTAALLYGFLGEDIENIGEVAVQVTKDTYFRDDVDSGLVRPCPGSKLSVLKSRMSSEFKDGMQAMEPFMQEMANMLMMQRKSLPTVTFIADYPLAYFCHGQDYPCTKKGCFNEQTTLKLLSYSDWYFYNKYKQFSDMLSLPVLTQIGTRMSASAQSQSPITLAVYGGHESSLIPVLQSLGTYNRRWIPYASRLVFELWSKNNENSRKTLSERSIGGRFMRVLFNGESVTHKLVFCKEKVIENGELCPLGVFLDWLGGGRFEDTMKRYDDMCAQ